MGSKQVDALFDRNNIPLFRDGNRLHVAPFLITDLFDKDYKIAYGESDSLQIALLKNGETIGEFHIAIKGPWPDDAEDAPQVNYREAAELLETITAFQGWDNFKALMNEVVSRCEVGKTRSSAGLAANLPRLHTAIIGNPGTGKTKAVELMAKLYKELTMKLMSRTIYQQVILRESALSERPAAHQVLLEDVATFKWDGRKGKIGF